MSDALHSTLALADGTGAIQTSYAYKPYGTTTQSGIGSANPARYTGREAEKRMGPGSTITARGTMTHGGSGLSARIRSGLQGVIPTYIHMSQEGPPLFAIRWGYSHGG